MFSPEASVLSANSSLRNPRRRQRKDSDGLPQQPRRKRSKLSQEVKFDSSPDARANGNGTVIMNGHANHTDVDSSTVLVEMPVRDKKLIKRPPKEDAATFLTKNENFSVRKLPGFPSRLANSSTPFRAFALPSAGLALATTSTHAFTWTYTSTSAAAKVVTLPLSFDLKPSDPLPLGAIVRNGLSNDHGILTIAPSSGKITYWASVDIAEATSHFPQRHQSIDGVVSKMYSGEVITDIVDIEHSGYILIFSSGRLAQLTLSDSQGRASIATSFLQSTSTSSGSFFSFKGLLGSGLRQSIASVKARPAQSKGHMEVVSATRNGVLKLWDLSWSGQHIFKREIDVHGEVLAALQSGTAPEARGQQEAHILDFAMLSDHNAQGSMTLMLLVALSGRNMLDYSLLELDLSNDTGVVSRAIPIRNFQQTQLPKEPTGALLIPRPTHTAFVHFPGAIVVASLAEPEESPDAQLFSDSGGLSLPFQDTIYFRDDRNVHVSGYAAEHAVTEKDRSSRAVFFLQEFGVIQVNAQPPSSNEEDVGRHKVTALSKLEQATFFSTVPDNVIDFSIKGRYSFGEGEVEQAAEKISAGVLSSSYDVLEKVTSSMEDQIRKRCAALRTLILQLRAEYPPLSFQTKWRLLWNAEKMAAALQLWGTYEESLRKGQADMHKYHEMALWPQMVKITHERFKTILRKELGETDPIRQFFLRDIRSLEVLLPWAWQLIRTFYLSKNEEDRPGVMERLSEANDILITAFETVFKFREDNAELYGIDPNNILVGVLKPGCGYDLLPAFWTSTHNVMNAARSIVDVGRQIAYESFEKGILEDLAKKLAKDNPRLVKISCQVHLERLTWNLEQAEEKKREAGRSLQVDYLRHVRPEQIYNLVNIGMAAEGMELAEMFYDMTTLARLVWNETEFLLESKETAQSKLEIGACDVKLNRLKDRIRVYFEKFGDTWARAYYNKFITEQETGQLLTKRDVDQASLSRFLRADPSRARLAWINEVSNNKSYESAGQILVEAATKQESNAWCKKVELSVAKLSLLCKRQAKVDQGQPEDNDVALAEAERQLEYSKIQDRVYERLVPTISGSLDAESAVQLLMQEFGQGLGERHAHQQLLRQGFESLVHHRVLEPALLIDVLTLMTYDESVPPTEALQSNEFAYALKALALSWKDMDKTTRYSTLKVIWKRLLVRDDWEAINDTKDVTDEQLSDFLAHTVAGWTLKAYLGMTDENQQIYSLVWPKPVEELLGAGCTDSELCTRFGSEDLRKPIINDNLADDEMLREHVEKHRLAQWFEATAKAAKAQHEQEKMEAQNQQQEVIVLDSDDLASVQDEAAPVELDENLEAAASEAFEGDDEQSVADQEDVDMEDA